MAKEYRMHVYREVDPQDWGEELYEQMQKVGSDRFEPYEIPQWQMSLLTKREIDRIKFTGGLAAVATKATLDENMPATFHEPTNISIGSLRPIVRGGNTDPPILIANVSQNSILDAERNQACNLLDMYANLPVLNGRFYYNIVLGKLGLAGSHDAIIERLQESIPRKAKLHKGTIMPVLIT